MGGIAGGEDGTVNAAFLVAGIISIVAVLAWIGLLVWGAIEDGREEKRHSLPPRH